VHDPSRPRRAGVSSFGFGGTNVHVTLEEYREDFLQRPRPASEHWPAELLVWQAATREELAAALKNLQAALPKAAKPELRALAAAAWRQRKPEGAARVAIVASSLDDLRTKLTSAVALIEGADQQASDPRGVYFSAAPVQAQAKIAFLFPGQGSQYPNMLAQLAMSFPVVRETLDHAQHVLAGKLERPLCHYLYPPSSFGDQEAERTRAALAATNVAQPAIGAANVAAARLLADFGLQPDMAAGHSYGEFCALWSARAHSNDD
jgi:acyl transferase domain-containing protein